MAIERKYWHFFNRPIKHFITSGLKFEKSLNARLMFGIGVTPLCQGWNDLHFVIHRYYLEQFLLEFSMDIRGHCLEFQEDSYTSRFGRERIHKIDILHKEAGNPAATLIADLTQENEIPKNTFDCIICTYTLHLVYEFKKMISELYRVLQQNGVLLIAVPSIMTCYPQYHEFWRFTPEGLHLLLSEFFGSENIIVRAYGNSLTAAGELRGLTIREFSKSELDQHDSRYPMVVCSRARKSHLSE